MNAWLVLTLFAGLGADRLTPGDSTRTITVGGVERSFRVHVPPKYDGAKPVPVVLCYHGAATGGGLMRLYSGLNQKADEAGFIAVYPNGTGVNDVLLTWNSGGIPSRLPEANRDDIGFTRAMLDDLAGVANIDEKRVFATGISNGGMMSHRLAVELPDRIAAIASVAGTLAVPDPKPTKAVPVMEIHGTEDRLVPWGGLSRGPIQFRSVDDTIGFWVKHNGCEATAKVEPIADKEKDDTTATRHTYAAGENGAEVVLVQIDGGGHTWPGSKIEIKLLGRTAKDFSANDLIWEFFEKHPMR